MKNKNKVSQKSLGKLIIDAMNEKNITIDILVEKINNPKINKKVLKSWINGYDFPNLDDVYKLSEILELNPNELLKLRNEIQDSNVKKPNWTVRKLVGRTLNYSKPAFSVFVILIEVMAAICVAVLIRGIHTTFDHMEDEVPNTFINTINDNQNSMKL